MKNSEGNMEATVRKSTLEMNALLLCRDVQFLGTTKRVLKELAIHTTIEENVDSALARLADREFDSLIVDWRELDSLGAFLDAVRKSKSNRRCIVVAIVRDLLDAQQAFAAGVHFLIQKPASSVQIERCLRAAHSSFVADRRKSHREPVQAGASLSGKNMPLAHVTILNIGEGGVGLRVNRTGSKPLVSAGDPVELNFLLPETTHVIHASGVVAWASPDGNFGVHFRYIPEVERRGFERWLSDRLERSLAEAHRETTAAALTA
jgi:ActR/RegA family two-component response regulator